MPVNLRALVHLHDLDQQLAALNQRISSIPIQIQEVDKKLERFQRNLQDKQKLIADNQKRRRELEGDLTLIETKRNRYKEQLDTVKTNKEYTALQHEIEGVNLAIREIEDQILAQMEEADQLKTGVEEAQKAKDKEESHLLEEKKVIQTEGAKLQAAFDELKQQRQGWIQQITPQVMEVYERVAMHRRGVAMAEARNEICQACRVRIRPQLFQEIKRNDSIIACESCSRILYYNPPPGEQSHELNTVSS
jgi:predicted  nucleic acid-binding Zn-ribbon protein